MAEHATAQEALFALREQIARLEGKPLPALAAAEQGDLAADPEGRKTKANQPRLPFGIMQMDTALEGGLLLDGITEIRSLLMGDAGAASGFALSLASHLKARQPSEAPVLWIGDVVSAQEAGIPYSVGLKQFGLSPRDILYASPRKLDDALWLAETAVASGALVAIILEIRGNPRHFGLTESRRLGLRAKAAGRPLFVLRHAGEEEASSASFRFLVEPAPAAHRHLPDGSVLGGSIGHPVFRLTLEKSRSPAPLSLFLEWNPHDRQFSLPRDAGEAFSFRKPPAHPGARLPAPADRQDRAPALGDVVALERAS
ncbi:ImuA family protein [Neorhizobium sp. LjRoot104]|uniref:ImuA family protein n=1 Tax=Neorhizobium sp. LjRoot104 TaxID=3342254 RepID=UPI003ECFF18E